MSKAYVSGADKLSAIVSISTFLRGFLFIANYSDIPWAPSGSMPIILHFEDVSA